MKKRLIAILLLVASATTLFTSCSNMKYEDTNGDDNFALATITKEQMIAKSTKSLSIGSVTKSSITKVDTSCSEFHGVKKIFDYKIGESAKTFTVTNEVTKGNFSLFVYDGKDIVKEFKLNSTEEYVVPENYGGIQFRVAGETAAFKVKIEVK